VAFETNFQTLVNNNNLCDLSSTFYKNNSLNCSELYSKTATQVL